MNWAMRRRFIIFTLLVAVGLAIFAVVFIASAYRAPSCHDGVQNEGEQGIDCGGPCPYLCTALEQAPTVLFTQAISNGAGRTDVVAAVVNKNATAAAKDVPYTITLYGADHTFLQRTTGTIDLPPNATTPVFVPGVASGQRTVDSAFLSIDSSSVRWVNEPTDPRIVPLVSNIVQTGTQDAPRIEATLTDRSTTPLTQVRTIVIVRDGAGNVIAASQTIVPLINGQGQATAVFTWNAPFSVPPVSIEVDPVIPLP